MGRFEQEIVSDNDTDVEWNVVSVYSTKTYWITASVIVFSFTSFWDNICVAEVFFLYYLYLFVFLENITIFSILGQLDIRIDSNWSRKLRDISLVFHVYSLSWQCLYSTVMFSSSKKRRNKQSVEGFPLKNYSK